MRTHFLTPKEAVRPKYNVAMEVYIHALSKNSLIVIKGMFEHHP